MARFVVLDHSLTRVGGHHYEQATQILRAADSRGYQPVLVTHRRFSQQDLLPEHWQVFALFPDESYDCQSQYPLDDEAASLFAEIPTPDDVAGRRSLADLWRHARQRLAHRQMRRRIVRFAAACSRMEEHIGLRDGDHVFIPTTSLFDLLGIIRFLQTLSPPPDVVWHALFHYGFLEGREPEYSMQSEKEHKIELQLHYLVENVPGGQLRFYATTQRLAEQFNRLTAARFDVLPFPVDNRALAHMLTDNASRPLRLTCAGFLRREKGKAWASRLVAGLWESELESGQVQLVVQTNRRQARRMLPPYAATSLRFHSHLPAMSREKIVWLRHPLTREAYIDLIRQSDVALFLHDDRAYYTRCSGVLVEMLAAGVPVLVPAGSWLADQIAEPIYTHLEHLAREATGSLAGSVEQVGWQCSSDLQHLDDDRPRLLFGGPSHEAHCEIHVPLDAAALLVSLRWRAESQPGAYIHLRVEQVVKPVDQPFQAAGSAAEVILSPRSVDASVSTLLHLAEGTSRVRLWLRNAYDDASIAVESTTFSYLPAPSDTTRTYPAGSVGLIFSDVEQVPALVRNMREHYPHYRHTAHQFAEHWRRHHDAQQIVATLLRDRHAVRAVA